MQNHLVLSFLIFISENYKTIHQTKRIKRKLNIQTELIKTQNKLNRSIRRWLETPVSPPLAEQLMHLLLKDHNIIAPALFSCTLKIAENPLNFIHQVFFLLIHGLNRRGSTLALGTFSQLQPKDLIKIPLQPLPQTIAVA